MQTLPREVLECFQRLEDGVKARIVVNTNGKGQWKTEVTVFTDHSAEPQVELAQLIEQMHLALLQRMS